jgi:hypothetical protein
MPMDCPDTAPATPLMFLAVADVGCVPILIAPAPLPERNQPLLRRGRLFYKGKRERKPTA